MCVSGAAHGEWSMGYSSGWSPAIHCPASSRTRGTTAIKQSARADCMDATFLLLFRRCREKGEYLRITTSPIIITPSNSLDRGKL